VAVGCRVARFNVARSMDITEQHIVVLGGAGLVLVLTIAVMMMVMTDLSAENMSKPSVVVMRYIRRIARRPARQDDGGCQCDAQEMAKTPSHVATQSHTH
jgi:hypothetical protein